jgi:hypothetical protein
MHIDDMAMLLKKGSQPMKAFLEALDEREKKLEEELDQLSTARFSLGGQVAPHVRERLEPPRDHGPFRRQPR